MLAIVAAVLFGLALLFDLTNTSIGEIGSMTLTYAGLLCVALHLAGVGTAWRGRTGGWSRRRRSRV
ncbi:hypothetical protein Val02_58230 [Virgisporangium aliadipatigenens]|uniref:Uncharacterized protein n=1 Tax=Virgisporangium aliadipatigenens TaxID=741659 RepID=A0A8J3YR36_9ACTN|nr:hypothetical protein [Virgisporangium aliadipatigenens]GIJ48937.1 hypothetical protein Val02_58230 [Virgisporangium aliadipatigenens]